MLVVNRIRICSALVWLMLAAGTGSALAGEEGRQTAEQATTASCQLDNAELQAMPIGEVQIVRADGTRFTVAVRIADNNVTRAAGFQRVCPSTMAKMPILFIFPRLVRPSFHMRNVVAPIDIAFIRQDGSLDTIQAMQPYVVISTNKPLYSPNGPVIAALEGRSQFYADHDIDESATVSWTLPSD